MPAYSKERPGHGGKPTYLDPDSDSGQGSCDSPSLLSDKWEELWANPPTFHTFAGLEEPENPNPNDPHPWVPQSTSLEGKTPDFHANAPKSTWPLLQPPRQHNPKFSYHNIGDVCKLVMGTAGASGTLWDKTDTGGKGTAAEQGEVEGLHAETDPGTAWLLPQDKAPFVSAKLLDYVEIHKINKDGALSLFPKQKEDSNQTEKAGTPEASKEYAKVSRVMDNSVLVLMQEPHAQNLALFEELAKEAPASLPQNQAENEVASFAATPSGCKLQLGGLDYLDPTCFKHSFQ